LFAQQADEDPPATQAALPHWKELPKDMQCRNEEKWEPQEIHEISNQGIASNNAKYAAIAKELCSRAAVGAVSLLSAGIRAGRHTTSFCVSLLHLLTAK
jgi:hypothetical protein